MRQPESFGYRLGGVLSKLVVVGVAAAIALMVLAVLGFAGQMTAQAWGL